MRSAYIGSPLIDFPLIDFSQHIMDAKICLNKRSHLLWFRYPPSPSQVDPILWIHFRYSIISIRGKWFYINSSINEKDEHEVDWRKHQKTFLSPINGLMQEEKATRREITIHPIFKTYLSVWKWLIQSHLQF